MHKFNKVYSRALKRKGGEEALKALMPKVLSVKQLSKVTNDRVLSAMACCIHQAGFNWRVIENKMPQMEEAYLGFDPFKLSLLPEEKWEAFSDDPRVIRNWQKIKAVKDNLFLIELMSDKKGSAAKFLAEWPAEDQFGLQLFLHKNGARLGGATSQWFLRRLGKDCFVTSPDVLDCLNQAGVDVPLKITAQRDMKRVQAAFNEWHQQSGLPFSHISRIAACSVGENYR